MTLLAMARSTQPQLAGQYRRLRSAHPVQVLRWLRNAVLLSVAAAVLLYLWVAIQAGSDIAAVNRTVQATHQIDQARRAVTSAGSALDKAFLVKDVTLLGAGPEFVNQITQVNRLLTLAAEGNAAGAQGTAQIQYVQNELASYLQASETAVQGYPLGGPLPQAELGYAAGAGHDTQLAIAELTTIEQTALDAQRRAWTLDPATFWWALLGPIIGMLLLVAATEYLVARHFRRHVGLSLWGSLLIAGAAMVTAGVFNSADARGLSANPWAGHPATMTVALLLLLAAAVLAQLAFLPRLAEYRFQP